jgi:hypothetical protein
MPARTGKGRRDKGRKFELKIIKDLWNGEPPWKLNESPDSGFRAPPPFDQWHLEMKNQESLNIWAALQQAEETCNEEAWPNYAVIFTRSRTPEYVAIAYETWKRLVRK